MAVAAHGVIESTRGWRLMVVLAALLLAPAATAQTRPGSTIVNTATLRQDGGTISSNAVTLTVAERLDVALARTPAADVVPADGTPAIAVTLTNRGSGEEAFVITAAVTAGSATLGLPQSSGAALADGRTASLAPGAAVILLLPVSGASADAVIGVTVRAVTGSGVPGTGFPGAGDGGSDAVVGPTGATATLSVPLTVAEAAPSLVKSQTVVAPDGSAVPIRGAAITYTLVAHFAAATAAADVADPIPAGTSYRPGSLTLDGAPLADAGHVEAGRIVVPLGAVAAGATRTLRFTVVIS